MKFSLAAASAVLLTTFASLARADEYADAIKEWCSGLDVPTPDNNTVVVAGQQTQVTVTRVPDERAKSITGLDLYSVSSDGKAQYIQNLWAGNYPLNTQASINETIPSNSTAGLYYFRVWVTNEINGMHGPDCIETSHTFKVTTGIHQNSDGISYYAESPSDPIYYPAEHFRGCFGLEVTYPKKDQEVELGKHVRVTVSRDKTSQTEALLKVDLYKAINEQEGEYVDTVWEGNELFTDEFNLKDHMVIPEEHLSSDASYYYVLEVTSKKSPDQTCKFNSQSFKVKASS